MIKGVSLTTCPFFCFYIKARKMIVLKPISTAQVLNFIPRQYNSTVNNYIERVLANDGTFEDNILLSEIDSTKIVLLDESTNTEVEIIVSFRKNKYYFTADVIFDLKEGRFYVLTVYNNTNIIYKDKVFCTPQNALNYSINKDVYTSNVTDNEYIIL